MKRAEATTSEQDSAKSEAQVGPLSTKCAAFPKPLVADLPSTIKKHRPLMSKSLSAGVQVLFYICLPDHDFPKPDEKKCNSAGGRGPCQ